MSEPDVIVEPVCFTCRYLLLWPNCLAFLDGIPKEIRDGKESHALPLVDDNGVQYERIERKGDA